jgi:hypothetical protein
MGDAIRTGTEGVKGVDPRLKTLVTKKRPVVYQGKGQQTNISKKPWYEDMSRKVCGILQNSQGSFPRCEVLVPRSFLKIPAEATPPQVDAKIHSSEQNWEECEGEDIDSRPLTPQIQQAQNSGRASLEPRSVLEIDTIKIPLKATKQGVGGIPETVPLFLCSKHLELGLLFRHL